MSTAVKSLACFSKKRPNCDRNSNINYKTNALRLTYYCVAFIITDIERFFCLDRLGMGDGSIPDYRITASSPQQREDGNCQPSNVRLTQSANSQTIGWCPDPNDINPLLQIDLEGIVIVEGIMMQQGSDQVINEDVSQGYWLEYSDDQTTWHTMGSAQVRTYMFNVN